MISFLTKVARTVSDGPSRVVDLIERPFLSGQIFFLVRATVVFDRQKSNSRLPVDRTENNNVSQNKLTKVAALFKKKKVESKWQVYGSEIHQSRPVLLFWALLNIFFIFSVYKVYIIN